MSDLPGLKEVLSAQCGVHRKLLILEEEKTRVLLAGDAEKLIPLLNDQQALLMQSRELEKQRNAICLGTEYKTLRELIESGGEYKALFGTVFEELTAVVMALKKKCALNKKLLETRLGTIRFLLNPSGQETGANTYTKNMSSKG
jgi:flagellar biosynthesis/type III secretory pathway chaperone